MSELADEFTADEAALADQIVDDLPAGEAEAAAEAEPTETEAAPAEAATPEAPAWTGPSQQEWEQVAGVVGYLGNVLAQAQQAEQPAPPEYDPYDANSVAELVSRTVQQTVAPLLPALQANQERDAVSQVETWLSQAARPTNEGGVGEFDQEAAAYVAHGFLPLAQGNPQLAVQKAAEYIVSHDKAVAEKAAADAVEAYKTELSGVAGAPRDLSGSGAPATEVVSFEKGQDELSVARQIAERIRLGATG